MISYHLCVDDFCHLGLVWKPRNPSVPRDFPRREIRGTSSPGKFIATFGSQRDVELQPASLRFPRGRNPRGMRPGALPRPPALESRRREPRPPPLLGDSSTFASASITLPARVSPHLTPVLVGIEEEDLQACSHKQRTTKKIWS